jgi:hypothetical protein
MCHTKWYCLTRGGLKIFKAWATQNVYSPNQRKTRQNHVFAEHLYRVHFVCTSPTWKIGHHDCVCVIIINKLPCQVCVCISESGRNKTQLVGKKDSLRGGKKALAKLASELKKLLANSKFHLHLASWRVFISTPGLTLCQSVSSMSCYCKSLTLSLPKSQLCDS